MVLGDFAKTRLLQPGEAETLTLRIRTEDMASYDYFGIKAQGGGYVLEAGDYDICLQSDSHTEIDSQTVTVEKDVIYTDAAEGKRPGDGITAVNRFDDVSNDGGAVYLSRAGWAGTMPTEGTPAAEEASPALVELLVNPQAPIADPSPADWLIVDSNLKLSEMRGVSYDDPQWKTLLDQISKGEMANLIASGG